jgi:hypothetical protein
LEIDQIVNAMVARKQAAGNPSLIPSANTTRAMGLLVPSAISEDREILVRPTYTPYEYEEFDPRVKGGPGSDLGWKWEKGLQTRQLFDQEQAKKAEESRLAYADALDAYNSEVAAKDKSNTEARRQLENYYASQGLIAPMQGDPSAEIRQWRAVYDNAPQGTEGDTIRQLAHAQAEALRQKAWGVSGGDSGELASGYMTSAGLPTYDKLLKDAELALRAAETQYAIGKPYSSGGSGVDGGLTPYQQAQLEQETQQAMEDWVTDKVENDYRLLPDYSNYGALYDAWKTMYVAQNYGGYKNPTNAGSYSGGTGNVDSWVNTAIQNKGAPAEWAEGIKWIISKESSGNPAAQNPKSTAYGLMQFLDDTWGNYGYKKTSDPVTQVEAGIDYIKSRYGTPANAVAFWQKNGWY